MFQRVPLEFRDRPLPTPPDIPSPGVVLRTGVRHNRSSVLDPVNVFAYGGVGLVIYLLAKKNQAAGAELPPAAPAGAGVAVNPQLAARAERERRNLEDFALQQQRDTGLFRDALTALDDLLFGKVESAAAERLAGGGAVSRRAGGAVHPGLAVGGRPGRG